MLCPRRTASLIAAVGVALGALLTPNTVAAQGPVAVVPNEMRSPAGRLVNGVHHVALDIVDVMSPPLGPKAERFPTVAFAERGRAPQLPGPLLRWPAGTRVRVSVRNTLAKAVHVRGIGDRARGDTAVNGRPAFFRADPLVLRAGEEREVTFTASTPVTSFYFASVANDSTLPPDGEPRAALVGALIVDPAGVAPDPAERIFLISIGAGLTINGSEWPRTERLRYTEGDTVRWRVINATEEYHPMHLHGFYFTVHTRGDAQADTVIAAARPLQVTEGMREFATMQLTWVPERAGNWLFHCHLLVHSQGPPPDSATTHVEHAGEMAMNDGMLGLIMGIHVAPRGGPASAPPRAARRLDLWTSTRAGMLGKDAAHGFVLQQGATRPSADSVVVGSSPLILTRGERTEIVVHNRLTIPLSLHWHGMELESRYDGVGHWSGTPGNMRPPIAPGDSVSAFFTPPRAGTFMYHVHGEPGAELQQGLYGALIVREPGQDARAERTFILASRGASLLAEPVINGRAIAPAERFDVGKTYRLRFGQISTNDTKTVRLLRDGAPVPLQPRARDGADLPVPLRISTEAPFRLDVGQTVDYMWTPTQPGVYVLEVTTKTFTFAGSFVQRVAFGVGGVADTELRQAATGVDLPVADVPWGALAARTATYGSPDGASMVSVWGNVYGVFFTQSTGEVESEPQRLVPLRDGSFVVATQGDGRLTVTSPDQRYRIDSQTLVMTGAGSSQRFTRRLSLQLSDSNMAMLVGRYANNVEVKREGEGLVMEGLGPQPFRLKPVSPSRFLMEAFGETVTVSFALKDGKATNLSVAEFSFTAAREPVDAPRK